MLGGLLKYVVDALHMVSVVVTAVEPFSAAWTLQVVHALALLAVADHGLLVLVAFSAVPAPVRQTFFARHGNDVHNVCKPNKQQVLTWVKENRSQGFSIRESVEKRVGYEKGGHF